MAKDPLSLGWSLRWPNKIEKGVLSTPRGLFNGLGHAALQVLKIPNRYILALLGYGLYILVLLTVFLYLTFPYQKLQNRLISMMEQALSCQIRVSESHWLFPLGLAWKEVHLRPQKGFKEDVVVDQARAKIYLLPLLGQNVQMDFFAEAHGGKVRGSFSAQRRDGKVHYYFQESAQDLELRLMGLDLPFHLEGRLRLDLEAAWQDQELFRGKGSSALELLNVKSSSVSLNGWQVPELSFGRIAVKLGLQSGMVMVENFTAQGPDLEAKGEGTLLLRNPWFEGLLNLTVKASLKEDLRQKFPVLAMMENDREPVEVMVKGTVRRPLMSVNGVPLNL
jgi:type II secretion system protein N